MRAASELSPASREHGKRGENDEIPAGPASAASVIVSPPAARHFERPYIRSFYKCPVRGQIRSSYDSNDPSPINLLPCHMYRNRDRYNYYVNNEKEENSRHIVC